MYDSRKTGLALPEACFYNELLSWGLEVSGTLVMLSYAGVAEWSGRHKDANCLTGGGPA